VPQLPRRLQLHHPGSDPAAAVHFDGLLPRLELEHDLRRCADFGNASGCVGGVGAGEGPCKPWLTGPYCRLCNVTDTSRYYDGERSECLPCEGSAAVPLVLGVVAVLATVVIVLLWLRFEPHRRIGCLARLSQRLSRLYNQLSLRAKGKQLLGFYQVATRVASVYDVPMPDAVKQLLSVFELFNINVGGIGLPMQCLGLGTYEQQLMTTMLLPIGVAVLLVLGFLVRSFCCAPEAKGLVHGLLASLPWLLPLSFLVFPMVSSAAFRAFSCEEFDDGRSYLRADYAVECGTEVHGRAESLAWLGIALYPIGISLLYVALLYLARHAIHDNKPTSLSKTLDFLVRDYEPAYLWWELAEAWKKLFLVGFAVLINPGSVVQLVAAFLFALVYMLLVGVAGPFKDAGDNLFAKACSFSLAALFFFLVILKQVVLTEAVDDVLSEQLRGRFGFDTGIVTIGMVVSIVAALALATVMAAKQLVAAARLPVVKLATESPPDLALHTAHRWHLFLSHIWGTGQDQCATIKRQLTLLMPGVSIFLDVDDLRDIGALEEYVDASAVIMIFVSKGYFKSGNCLREAECTVTKQKPITLVHDPVKGGAKLDFIRDEECPEELRPPIFHERSVIEWHRIKDFQLVSLKLLAQQLLLGCPSFAGQLSVPLFVPGEIALKRLAFRSAVTLYASPNNPGAAAAAERLRVGTASTLQVSTTPVTAEGEEVPDGQWQPPGATHLLLYLCHETYLGARGEALAEELRRAREAGFPIVMLHENDMDNGGCEFGRFFETTPQDLISGGLYKALAFAAYSGAFWPVSVALVAQALGASAVSRGGFQTETTAKDQELAPESMLHC